MAEGNVELVRRLQPPPSLDLAALFRDEAAAAAAVETVSENFTDDFVATSHQVSSESYSGLEVDLPRFGGHLSLRPTTLSPILRARESQILGWSQEMGAGHVEWSAAAAPVSGEIDESEKATVLKFDDLLWFRLEIREGRRQLLDGGGHPLGPAINPHTGKAGCLVELDLWIKAVQEETWIAAIPGFVHIPEAFDVLLLHRPRSFSRRGRERRGGEEAIRDE